MRSRVLPILNAIGCLALTGLVVSQWQKERDYLQEKTALQSRLADAEILLENETKHSASLERDISALKETLELTRKTAEEASLTLAEKNDQADKLQTELTAAREQIKTWETSIAERDAKLRSLDESLTATRTRLDEAVAKLKAAGAR